MPDVPSFLGVAQIGVVTTQPEKMIAFYRDDMGFPVLFEAGAMTFLRAGATTLMIGAVDERIEGDVIVYFEPDDWSAAEAHLLARGVVFERPAQVVQRQGEREHVLRPFRDPEGRLLYLLGWRPA